MFCSVTWSFDLMLVSRSSSILSRRSLLRMLCTSSSPGEEAPLWGRGAPVGSAMAPLSRVDIKGCAMIWEWLLSCHAKDALCLPLADQDLRRMEHVLR